MEKPKDVDFELAGLENDIAKVSQMAGITEAQTQKAEAAVDLVNRMKIAALRLTKPEHWTDFGGANAYLDDTGAMMIARQFGINFEGMKTEREYLEEDGVRIMLVLTSVTASFLGGSTEETGVATSRDSFVGLRKGKWLPISEINIGNLIRKSITNAKSRATKKLLGLSYTWADLANAGIRQDLVKKAYREGGGGKPTAGAVSSSPPATPVAPPPDLDEEQLRKDLRAMCLDLSGGDAKAAGNFLKEQSSFEGRDGRVEGKSRVDWLKGKWLQSTYGKVKKLYEETKKLPVLETPPEDDPFSHPSEPGENG